MTNKPTPGRDTATGTDPDARYDRPGYEDKSFGQTVSEDEELAEALLEDTGGDVEEAEERFDAESSGSPAIKRQRRSGGGSGTPAPDPVADAEHAVFRAGSERVEITGEAAPRAPYAPESGRMTDSEPADEPDEHSPDAAGMSAGGPDGRPLRDTHPEPQSPRTGDR